MGRPRSGSGRGSRSRGAAAGVVALLLATACGERAARDDVPEAGDAPDDTANDEIEAGPPDADSSADTGGDLAEDAGGDVANDAEVREDGDAEVATARRVFGVTVTDPWVADVPDSLLAARLDGLVGAGGRRPTARVVFDEGIDQVFRSGGLDASAYVPLVGNIAPHAVVMGELLDSFYVPDYDADQYRARACEYRATLGHLVELWEVGNEVNGEWLGDGVLEKLAAATEVFATDAAGFAAACPGFTLRADERPFRIALTFYYNGPYAGGVATVDNCWSEASHAMDRWVEDGFVAPGAVGTERIAPHVDLALVSYYEDDCEDLQPIWAPVFEQLGTVFPEAALGFGECGTERAAAKAAYVERYYRGIDLPDPEYANMHVAHPRFVGGYFWWYFSTDLHDAEVYGALADALASPFWAATEP